MLPGFTPPVSLLKPVRGLDFDSYENFVSFCQQDYPEYEILFCVNDMSDPAVPVIQRIMAEYPEQKIRIFSNAPQIGTNRKVNNLALLTREADMKLSSRAMAMSGLAPGTCGKLSRRLSTPQSVQQAASIAPLRNGISARNWKPSVLPAIFLQAR